MKLFIILFIIIITPLQASIYTDNSKKRKYIEPQYQEYLNAFWQVYSDYTKGTRKFYKAVSIVTDKTASENSIAECWTYTYGNPVIVINKERFNRQSTIQQMATIFHEITHCVLNFNGHIDDVHPEDKSCPASIMHSRKISNECLNKHFPYYMNRLVGPNRDKFGK